MRQSLICETKKLKEWILDALVPLSSKNFGMFESLKKLKEEWSTDQEGNPLSPVQTGRQARRQMGASQILDSADKEAELERLQTAATTCLSEEAQKEIEDLHVEIAELEATYIGLNTMLNKRFQRERQ